MARGIGEMVKGEVLWMDEWGEARVQEAGGKNKSEQWLLGR